MRAVEFDFSRHGPDALGSNCCKFCNSSRGVEFARLNDLKEPCQEMADGSRIAIPAPDGKSAALKVSRWVTPFAFMVARR